MVGHQDTPGVQILLEGSKGEPMMVAVMPNVVEFYRWRLIRPFVGFVEAKASFIDSFGDSWCYGSSAASRLKSPSTSGCPSEGSFANSRSM